MWPRRHRVEGSRSSARLRHVQPDLWGQEQVRAHLRTPILQSARAHISRAVSLRDTVYETLSDSPPKQGAPEATSTIALSLRMVLTPHSRLACWLAAWLHWQHHPRWAGRCPSAARGKPPGSGRARQVETTGREHGHRCCVLAVLPTTVPSLQPTGWTEDRSPGSRTLRNERFVAVSSLPAVEQPNS